ncbi:MAG TPA: metal ABC transporter permease [Candidatus Limnocylindrales bacterium]|nr:metal ABC transporter permease [Candidatus Limnocylindrales bacterium]
MSYLLEPLVYGFFERALVASVLVGLVCAVVGVFVVLRGLAFLGDALSHAAFPGVVIAYLAGLPFYLGAAVAAVGTSLAVGWVQRRGPIRSDTAIGVLFAGMFAVGVFLFSRIPNYVGDLFGFLFGDVLAIGVGDLISLAALSVVVLVIVGVLRKELLFATFDPLGAAAAGLPVRRLDDLFLALVAIAIVVSLQAVGIILVVAMLVTPAATAQLLTIRFGRLVAIAAGIGVIAPVVGLYVSYWLNAASGATIVIVESLLFAAALGFRAVATRPPRRPAERSTRADPVGSAPR